jgi:uncharacterized damage-inducible protein DinB
MELQKIVSHVFLQLSLSLDQLENEQFGCPCKNLSGNTVGQHVRHIIEMFQCLETGYMSGEVDYDRRRRDHRIESDKKFATELLQEITGQLTRKNKSLQLLTYYDDLSVLPERIETNYYREIAYNLEHTIHHMALIRVGLRELGDISVDDSYGVAASTLKYRKQCVQ